MTPESRPNQLLQSLSLITTTRSPSSAAGRRPSCGLHAQRGVDVVGRKRHRNPFDAIVGPQRRGPPAEEEDAVEKLRALLVMEVELDAEPEAVGEVRAGRRAGQHDEAVGVGKGQRPEQDRVDDVEHPDHRADRERQGDDRRDEKARRAEERPPGVPEVR